MGGGEGCYFIDGSGANLRVGLPLRVQTCALIGIGQDTELCLAFLPVLPTLGLMRSRDLRPHLTLTFRGENKYISMRLDKRKSMAFQLLS